MEILVLMLLVLAMVFTFFVIALKLVWLGGKLLVNSPTTRRGTSSTSPPGTLSYWEP